MAAGGNAGLTFPSNPLKKPSVSPFLMSNSVHTYMSAMTFPPQHVVFSACKHNPQRRLLTETGFRICVKNETSALVIAVDLSYTVDLSVGMNEREANMRATRSFETFLTFCAPAAPHENGVAGEVALPLCFPACGGMTELNSGRCS